MGFFSSLKDVCKVIGKSVTGGPAVIKLAEDGIKAHQQAKSNKRERRPGGVVGTGRNFQAYRSRWSCAWLAGISLLRPP